MERTARRAALLGGAATLLGALALGAGAAPAQAAGAQAAAGAYFSTWATDVNMRYDVNRVNGDRCPESPSPAHCPDVLGRAQPGDRLRVTCQIRGETVGGNPYWVFAYNETRGTYGWMASYFINHPDNVLPGVPTPCYGP